MKTTKTVQAKTHEPPKQPRANSFNGFNGKLLLGGVLRPNPPHLPTPRLRSLHRTWHSVTAPQQGTHPVKDLQSRPKPW